MRDSPVDRARDVRRDLRVAQMPRRREQVGVDRADDEFDGGLRVRHQVRGQR